MKLLKQATYIRYAIVNLSKFVQINMLISTESLLQRIPGTNFQVTFFVEFFDKKIILLPDCVYFPSYSIICVSCFMGIWWCHDIWISKILKVDYLTNEKSLVSQVLSYRHTKQTSKNVADTTFNTEPWDIKILGWCPAGSVLSYREKVLI